MAWWNELWLNEGFASYMQYKALDVIHPEWKTMEQFLSANSHSVMALDATLGSHPIVVKVETPDEITAIFDSISYNKGAAVLRMLEDFVGPDNFQKGVTDYLNEHKFNNSVTQNLLDKLANHFSSGDGTLNITHIMDTWTRQMGLPLVSVEPNNDGSYTLRQKRFLADPESGDGEPSPYNYRWFIPITYTTNNGKHREWFSDKDDSVRITPPNGEKIIKLNNDQVGYYRVTYSTDMWEAIEKDMNQGHSSMVTVSDKGNILNDVFALAEAGSVHYELALKISNYLEKENNYLPWAVASSQFTSLKRLMSESTANFKFQAHVRRLLKNVVEFVGWTPTPEEAHIVKLTRSIVLNLACSFGDGGCLTEAEKLFKDWLVNKTAIDSDIKGIVYYYGIQQTNTAEWETFYARYLEETDAQEISRMMQSLSASRDPDRLKWYLKSAWEESVVRSQDYFSVMQYISANPAGTSVVWEYFKDNWNRIKDRFTLNSRTLGTTVPAITRTFATESKLKEMKDFFNANPEAGAGETARRQAIETVSNNIKWMSQKEPQVREWFASQS